MQNCEKILVKSLVLSSAIVAGVALNSTNSMAAEVDVDNAESHSAELTDETKGITRNNAIKEMADACEIVEADAVAEEGYLNQAKEAIENNEINPEVVEEVLEGASAVLDQAEEQKKNAEEKYNEIVEEKEIAEADFTETGDASGFGEYVEACKDAEDNQEKEKIVDEAISKNNDIHDTFLNQHGETSEEYLATLEECNNAESEYNKANSEYENIINEWETAESAYNDAFRAYQEAKEYLYNLENQIIDKERQISYSERDYYGWDLRLEWYKDEYDGASALVDKTTKEVEGIQESLDAALKKYEETNNENDKKAYEEILGKYNAKCEQLKKQTQDLAVWYERYNSYLEEINAWQAELEVMLEEYEGLKTRHEEYSNSDEYKNCCEQFSEADSKFKELDSNKETSYTNLTKQTQELNIKMESKRMLDAKISAEERRYSFFDYVAVNFKNALINSDEAQGFLKRAEEGYNRVKEVYADLIDVLFEYQQVNKKAVDEVYSSERFNETISSIESSASAEEALVDQTKQLVENGEMTEATRAELISQAEEILRQAQEQRQSIQSAKDDIGNYVQNIRAGFEWCAKRSGLGDYLTLLDEADSYDMKIAIIDEMLNRNNIAVSQMRVSSNEVVLGVDADMELGAMFNEIASEYKEALALYKQAEEMLAQSDKTVQEAANNVEVIKKIAVVSTGDENDSVVDEIVANVVRIGKQIFGNAFANFEQSIVSTIRCVAGKLSPEMKKCVLDLVKSACK